MNFDLNALIEIAIEASLKAGDDILTIYNSDDFESELKMDNSPLTLADRKAHQRILYFLKKTDFPILSEEGRQPDYEERREWKTYWLVDPLDGTKEFLKRNGEFTVNIALIHNETPILGVIYSPTLNELYFAHKEMGAYKLDVSDEHEYNLHSYIIDGTILPSVKTEKYTIASSRSHFNTETKAIIEECEEKYGVIDLISCGSSRKLCMIAEGKAHLYPRLAPTKEWDTAAGQAIVECAGGQVLNLETGKSLSYNKPSLLNPFFMVEREFLVE